MTLASSVLTGFLPLICDFKIAYQRYLNWMECVILSSQGQLIDLVSQKT